MKKGKNISQSLMYAYRSRLVTATSSYLKHKGKDHDEIERKLNQSRKPDKPVLPVNRNSKGAKGSKP